MKHFACIVAIGWGSAAREVLHQRATEQLCHFFEQPLGNEVYMLTGFSIIPSPVTSTVANFASMKYWLVKSEPEAYAWADFVQEGGTDWTGVRNYQARNNLQAMQPGDLALFYHSVSEKAVVGVALVHAPAAPDTTAEAGSPWVAVHLRPHAPLARPVPLAALKAAPELAQLGLLRQSRLSVTPVRPEEFDLILALSEG